jgi:hypothetical protein
MPRRRYRKRDRPTQAIVVLSSEERQRLRRKWRRWIQRISTDLAIQLLHNETYRELGEVVKANPRIQSPGDIHRWMVGNYIAAASLGVRRLTDKDQRSPSFWRLLYELLRYPNVITRQSHRSLYKGSRLIADLTFDGIAGRGRQVLGPGVVRHDLRSLEDTVERIHRFANKRIAHLAPQGSIRKLPTFATLEDNLKYLDELVRKYNTLLTASGHTTLKPTRQYYWRSILFEPWIPKGSPLRAGFSD